MPAPWQGAPSEPAWNAPDEGAGGFSLRRIMAAVMRYKWLVLAVTCIGAGGGYLATRFATFEYQAQSTLWIGNEGNVVGRGPIESAELFKPDGWLELIRSYTVLDHVVQEQRLYLEPKEPSSAPIFAGFMLRERFVPGSYRLAVDKEGRGYTLSMSDGAEVERGAVGAPVGAALGFDWTPPPGQLHAGRVIDFTVRVPREVAVKLSREIRREMGADNRLIKVSYTDDDPVRVAAVVNSLNTRVVAIAAELKRMKLDELTTVLGEQLRLAENALQDAEVGLESFRVQTIMLPSERAAPIAAGLEITTNPVLSNFFTLKVQSDQLRIDRESIRRIVAAGPRDGSMVAALGMVPSVQATPEFGAAMQEVVSKRAELRQLQQRYTDQHESVVKMASDLKLLEEQTVPAIARSVADNLQAREAELASQVQSASGELTQIPPRVIEEARNKRRVAIAEQLYTSLRQRYEDARLAALSTIPDLRVLDQATVPQNPVSDPRLVFMLMGVLGGLAAGLAGAVLLDRVDPRFQHPEQVTQLTGLSILGAVPHVRTINGMPDPQAAAAVAEAFREVRLSLLFAHPHDGAFELTLTSPGSGDGKSFISLNLALAFAELGKSTLLIDGDIRRGALHRMFSAERSPGLTDYLAGNVAREQLVRATDFANLDVIPSGSRMQVGPELLGSARMSQLMQHLRSRYEVIIVDSAPMGAGSDAYTLATLTGNLALVLRAGRTNREFTEAKLGMIDRLPIRLLGAVLNDVPASRLYSYYPYLAGYEAHDEAPGAGTAVAAGG